MYMQTRHGLSCLEGSTVVNLLHNPLHIYSVNTGPLHRYTGLLTTTFCSERQKHPQVSSSMVKSQSSGGHRERSGVKNTYFSCTQPGLGSQHPHGGSQISVTPAPGDPIPSSDLPRHQAGMWCTDIYTGQHTYT